MKLLLALFLLGITTAFSPEKEDLKIAWDENKKLSWSDFQGRPEPGKYVASTNSGISFTFSYTVKDGKVAMDYEVKSNFYPKLSWYIPAEVDDYILQHEQTHFDISELHARMLRKKIEATLFTNNAKREVEALYKEIERQRRSMQVKFDIETDHSKNEQAEFKWEVYIAKQLRDYERWK